MKHIFLSSLIAFFFISCTKEAIEKNIPNTSVYLVERSLEQSVNFANIPESTTDVTLDIIVRTIGGVQNHDRRFLLVPQDSSSAIAGVDYVIDQESLMIKAGELTDTVRVTILRNSELPEEGVKLYLQLIAGDAFDMEFPDFKNLCSITIINQVKEPEYWYWFAYDYLGDYSEKKFKILQDVADMPSDALDVLPETERDFSMLIGRLKRWGLLLKRYLDQQHANNNTVYEADGVTRMDVGDYMY